MYSGYININLCFISSIASFKHNVFLLSSSGGFKLSGAVVKYLRISNAGFGSHTAPREIGPLAPVPINLNWFVNNCAGAFLLWVGSNIPYILSTVLGFKSSRRLFLINFISTSDASLNVSVNGSIKLISNFVVSKISTNPI